MIYFIRSDLPSNLLVFGEKDGMEARDNSFCTFASMFDAGRRDVYFLAQRKCRDAAKLQRFGANVVRYGSLRHHLLAMRARLLIVNDGYQDVYPGIANVLRDTDAPFFYVQHGILRYKRVNFTAGHYWGRLLRFVVSTDFEVEICRDRMISLPDAKDSIALELSRSLLGLDVDLLTADGLRTLAEGLQEFAIGAAPHAASFARSQAKKAENISKRVGLPISRIVQTGLPRHDRIQVRTAQPETNEVLIFFTWRESWATKNASKSPIVGRFKGLFQSDELRELTAERGLRFRILMHSKQRHFAAVVSKILPDFATIDLAADFATASDNALAVITDYSSVAFDCCLKNIPVLFYQPDRPTYLAERGDWVRSEDEWVGPRSIDAQGLVVDLRAILEAGGPNPEYRERLLETYPTFGSSTEHVIQAIDQFPPRVMFVAYNIFGTGGTVRVVTDLANDLFKKGCHVEVISMRRNRQVPDMGLNPAIRVYSLQDHQRRQTFFERVFRRFASVLIHKDSDLYANINLLMDIRLARRLRSSSADVIVATFPALAGVCHRFKRRNSRLIVQEHQYFEAHKPSIQKLIRKTYPKADAITVLSDRDARDQPPNAKAVFKVPNGVAASVENLPQKNPTPRIIGLGRFQDWKRFDLLIKAFALLADEFPEWEMVVYGNGDERENLEQLVNDLGLADRVSLPGSTRDSLGEIARSEICAVPSQHEPFGMVLIEAYAASRPVVSFDVETGPKEIVIDGETGFRAVPGDVHDFADKLRTLMQDEDLREQFGRRGHELYLEKYSIRASGERFQQVIAAVAGR